MGKVDTGQRTEGLSVFKKVKKRSQRSAQRAQRAQRAHNVEVLFDQRLFDYMLQELSKDLSVEEGGKYLGYLIKAGDPLHERIGSRTPHAIVIVDFLPSGPNAKRTAVELMPDGPYQDALFQRMVRLDPAIEHVGTWHSHQCNGLRRLSDLDVKGYLRTVSKPAYRPDFLVASLVKDVPRKAEDEGWIDHFLFVRGEGEFHKITDAVRLVDVETTFGALTGHSPTRREAVLPAEMQPAPQQQTQGLWFESPEGRHVLAEDNGFFDKSFDSVVATRRDSRITITGRTGSRALAVTFPRDPADQTVSMMVRVDDSRALRIECDLANRTLAYKAALAVLAAS